MKLVKEEPNLGKVTVIPEDSDDLYVLYNILTSDDLVSTKSSRKLKREDTGSAHRVIATIEIRVKEIEFHGFGEMIRVSGLINYSTDDQISLGSHHTLKLELRKSITITKESWSQFERQQLERAKFGQSTGLLILVIDDESAVLAQVGNHASKILLELRPTITRKGSDPNQYQKSLADFYKQILSFLNDLAKENEINHLIICGPGFTHEHFTQIVRRENPHLGSRTTNIAINNAGISGITELLTHHLPDNFLEDNNARIQAKLINEVLEHLGRDTGMVAYGKNILKAVEGGMVEHLLILDTQLRTSVEKRKAIEVLIQKIIDFGGRYTLMSSMLDTGSIIEGFGGIIAILRFKME